MGSCSDGSTTSLRLQQFCKNNQKCTKMALDYDVENRLVSTSNPSATFVYDGDGVRVKGTIGGTTTPLRLRQFWEKHPKLHVAVIFLIYLVRVDNRTGSTSTMKKYYYHGGIRVAVRVGSGTGTTGLTWLLGDHLGSTTLTTTNGSSVSAETRYKAFGEDRYNSGTMPTTMMYTGQREESGLGLYFYNARWYDAKLGRFVQADTIVPGPGNPMAWDRYAYVYNNPVKYFDPSGHIPQCGPDGMWCSDSSEEQYWLFFIGSWSSNNKSAVISGVESVARKFSAILSMSNPGMAFAFIFGYISFEMGNCDQCKAGSDVAGYTYSAHEIRFAGLSNKPSPSGDLYRRNHVVHELGHAFKWLLYGQTGIDVYTVLGNYRRSHPTYPNRETFDGSSGTTGPNYGFASLQNQTSWQVSLDGGDSEEFADQFLGWTFNMWETDYYGLTDNGRYRSQMMSSYMPVWVNLAATIRE